MFSWIFGHKKNVSHILAIDLGTASISAAMVLRHDKKNSQLPAGYTEVLKVFRYPINLFGYQVSGEGDKLPFLLKDGFLKVFKDARGVSGHLDSIFIALADPFFLDKKLEKKNERPNPDLAIAPPEVNSLIKLLADDASAKPLATVSSELLDAKVSGYDVSSPMGYKGKSLDIEAIFTLISPTLKNYVEEAKDKFFPRAALKYFSDARVLWRALKATQNLFEPVLVVDIGGEVTGIFLADSGSIDHLGAAAFGIRTLGRRVAASLKIELADAEAMMRKYTAGVLDDAFKSKLGRALPQAMADWWLGVKNLFKALPAGAAPKQIMLTGGGADFLSFSAFLKDNFSKEYGVEAEVQIFISSAFKDFLDPPEALAGGGDVILAALALFAS